MALIQKISPVGLDKAIDLFQSYIYTKLGYSDWECYPRGYKNPKKNGLIPEFYEGGDYDELLFDDKHSITSFFISNDRKTLDNGLNSTEVSLIVQANLEELFPTIPHRADEELHNDIMFASNKYGYYDHFKLVEVLTGIDNVYREFIKDDVKLDDMNQNHVVRFVYEVKYMNDCCTNC